MSACPEYAAGPGSDLCRRCGGTSNAHSVVAWHVVQQQARFNAIALLLKEPPDYEQAALEAATAAAAERERKNLA